MFPARPAHQYPPTHEEKRSSRRLLLRPTARKLEFKKKFLDCYIIKYIIKVY